MQCWHYNYSGLHVQSELSLPEWAAFGELSAPAVPDVVISLREEQAGISEVTETVVGVGEYRFSAPGIGIYHVRNGREIVIFAEPSAADCDLRLFLLGSAWGALCYQRGLMALHSGAVKVGGVAAMFCAPPGGGKSSMVAHLVRGGHQLISDDLCRIDLGDSKAPMVYPSTPRLKLRPDVINSLGWQESGLARDSADPDKVQFNLPDTAAKDPIEIGAIYILEWGECGLEQLRGRAALYRFLAAATYRPALIGPSGCLDRYWRACIELIAKVPVWELKRPLDLTKMDEVVGLLELHWQTLWRMN